MNGGSVRAPQRFSEERSTESAAGLRIDSLRHRQCELCCSLTGNVRRDPSMAGPSIPLCLIDKSWKCVEQALQVVGEQRAESYDAVRRG